MADVGVEAGSTFNDHETPEASIPFAPSSDVTHIPVTYFQDCASIKRLGGRAMEQGGLLCVNSGKFKGSLAPRKCAAQLGD